MKQYERCHAFVIPTRRCNYSSLFRSYKEIINFVIVIPLQFLLILLKDTFIFFEHRQKFNHYLIFSRRNSANFSSMFTIYSWPTRGGIYDMYISIYIYICVVCRLIFDKRCFLVALSKLSVTRNFRHHGIQLFICSHFTQAQCTSANVHIYVYIYIYSIEWIPLRDTCREVRRHLAFHALKHNWESKIVRSFRSMIDVSIIFFIRISQPIFID